MTHASPKRIGGLVLAATFVVAACGGSAATTTPTTGATVAPITETPSGAPLAGTITIDGSSTVFPISEAIAEEFQIANPGVQVPVAFSGTGGGFKKFCNGETDLSGASRPIKAQDEGEGLACEENDIEYVELQVAIDGLSVVVHPDNDWATCLTVDELSSIYGPDAPENLNWSGIRAGFPDEPINRYQPGADSGTFDYFTEAINGESQLATRFATQSEDDNVLVTGVSGDVNAIGYFGYAYFEENRDKLVAIGVDGGDGCVVPSPETINDGSYKPLSRPLFIYPSLNAARERAEVRAFVDFLLENTNELSAEVGYIEMPDDKLAAEKAEWAAAIGG